MKVTHIHYFFTAPNGLYWNKIGAEAELIEGEDVRQCLYDLKRQVESFFYESKAAAEKQNGTKVYREGVEVDANYDSKTGTITIQNIAETPASPKSQEQTIIDAIGRCTEIDGTGGLKSYELVAKNNAAIKIMYDLRLKQLQ